MLVVALLTKHQVRDSRTSKPDWSTDWSSSFVDSFLSWAYYFCAFCLFIYQVKFKRWLVTFRTDCSDIRCCWWETSSSIESFRSTWRIIWSWNGFDFDIFGFDIRKLVTSIEMRLMKWYINYINLIYYYYICQPGILPAFNCWNLKDHKTVAMTLLCGEEPLLLLRRVSELLIVFAISKDHE